MPVLSKLEIARAVNDVGESMGITPKGVKIAYATISVECGWLLYANAKDPDTLKFPHDRVGSDGRSSGFFQQQPPWWGGEGVEGARKRMDVRESARMFFTALAKLPYNTDARTPGWWAQTVQGSAFPDRYDTKWAEAQTLYAQITGGKPVGWTGDPVWLEDVLRARPLLKDKVRVLDGWDDRGHGDFGDVWGVMWHHTGNGRATAESIRDGRPDLEGPVSNIHIGRDGIVTVVAVGVAWHAGAGSGFGLPANDANDRLIGVECAWPMDTSITKATQTRERWPDAQIISMREVGAALTLKLGYDAGHNIGHKEWAGAAQGKWDPGNLDMGWFRGEITKSMSGEFGTAPVPTPAPVPVGAADDQLTLRWACLGGQTLVEAVAQIRDTLLGTRDRDKTGAV